MSQYDAIAAPLNFFAKNPLNSLPYDAVLPDRAIAGQVNERDAYRSEDSDRLIARFDEDSTPDMELNDILWGSIKGAKTPRPNTPGALWHNPAR